MEILLVLPLTVVVLTAMRVRADQPIKQPVLEAYGWICRYPRLVLASVVIILACVLGRLGYFPVYSSAVEIAGMEFDVLWTAAILYIAFAILTVQD